MQLLSTKLYVPPERPELVPRPRLAGRLSSGLHRKLTLVCAPAGFGKTTLVTDWLRDAGRPVAWLSVDTGDNDLSRFLDYLVAALQQVDDGFGKMVKGMLEAPQPPPADLLLTDLINDIAARPRPFVLVLDDLQAITQPAVHQALSFLLDRQPPHMHLVIVTRQDPPIPLSRLRGRDQVTEIRQSDLRFNKEEAAAFLKRVTGSSLEEPEVAALERLTEGWIAGLQMSAVALQSRIRESGPESVRSFVEGFSGRHQFILDYLTDEVLEGQPESIHTFLLQTSVLERMCGSLCEAVVGWESEASEFGSCRDILEYLHRSNLFVIPLDNEGEWYRYHRLFAELLRARLQESAPEHIAGLKRRSAEWHEQNLLLAEAVHYALEIPDCDLAAGMIERAIPTVGAWSSVSVAVFREWLDALPSDALRARPRLRLFASRVHYVSGRREETERFLLELEESLRGDIRASGARDMLGSVLADRASYAAVRGDVEEAITLGQQALTHLPEDPMMRMRVTVILGLAHFRSGNVSEAGRAFSAGIAAARDADLGFMASTLYCNLAEVQIAKGRLHQASETCRDAMKLATVDGTPTTVAGYPGLELGKILYEQNDLPAAERYVSEALDLLVRSGTTDSFGIGHALLARIRQAGGDREGALEAIWRARQIAAGFGIERVSSLIAAQEARLWLAQDRLGAACRWAQTYRRSGEKEYLREFEDLTLARVLLADHRPSESLALLDGMRQRAEPAGRTGTVIEIWALCALGLEALDREEEAAAALGEALMLARGEKYVRLFVDEGEPMAQLLRRAASAGIEPGYARRLLAAYGAGSSAQRTVDMSGLVEPLSDRELEVLGLLGEALTNPEIAERLFISLPTVKSHTRNIYGKLGVHNRREAVAVAKELALLPL